MRTGSAQSGGAPGSTSTTSWMPFLFAVGAKVFCTSRSISVASSFWDLYPERPCSSLFRSSRLVMSARKTIPLAADGLDELFLLAHQLARDAGRQHVGVADDAGERGSELVAHGGEEVRLEAVELLEAVVRLLERVVLLGQLAVALPNARDVHLAGEGTPDAQRRG